MDGLTASDRFSRRKFLGHTSALGMACLLSPWHTARGEPPPQTRTVRRSHLYLEQEQKKAYAELGSPPPTFSAESLLRRKAESLDALRDGGPHDLALQQRLKEIGRDPALSHAILDRLRRGVEQVTSHHNLDRILKDYYDVPTPHVNPFHHATLKSVHADINALYQKFPQLSFAGELQKLNGRVTISTLPILQVNARVIAVPETDEYLIVFDPVFFDFLYYLSNNFAHAVEPTKARKGAERYALSGQETPISEAIRYGDPSVIESFFSTLSAFLTQGLPPFPEPYDEQIFSLAEHLRNTGTLFIAAHEYAHILLRHPLPQGRSKHGKPGSAAWKQELEADWLA
jgi:hypothetical protein